MAISKYTRFGLRADRNLSDLTNKSKALANILDDFTPGQTFTPSDLTVINGLKTTNVFAEDLAPLANTEVLYTPIVADPNTGGFTIGVPAPVEPLITIKDIIQTKKVILGDPAYHLGGTGPNAFVVPPEALKDEAGRLFVQTETITADDVFDTTNAAGRILTDEDYWIDGRFAFGGPLHPTFTSSFGALCWEGHFSAYYNNDLSITSNAFCLFEEYNESTSSWETIKRVSGEGSDELSIDLTGSASNQLTGLTVNPASMPFAWEGMKITQGSSTYKIIDVNHSAETIDLEKIDGPGSGLTYSSGVGLQEFFTWNIGEDDLYVKLNPFGSKAKGQTNRIRITVWYPRPDQFGGDHTLIPGLNAGASTNLKTDVTTYGPLKFFFNIFDSSDTVSSTTPFNYWYKTPQLTPDSVPKVNTFDHFKRNRISGRLKKTDQYLQNEKPVYIDYAPTTSVNDYVKNNGASVAFTYVGEKTFSTSATFVEEGDILLSANANTTGWTFFQVYEVRGGTIITEPFRGSMVEDLTIGNYIIVGQSQNYFVVKPKGLLGVFQNKFLRDFAGGVGGNHELVEAGNSYSGLDVGEPYTGQQYSSNDIRPDDLLITLNATQNTCRKLTSITITGNAYGMDDVLLTTNPIGNEEFDSVADDWSLVYAHRGLSDHSVSAQCDGVYGKEVAVTANSGATQIFLTDVSNIDSGATGDFVQLPGIVSGTNTTRVSSVNSATNPPSITLSTGLIGSLPASRTLIFVKDANDPGSDPSTGDKELCIIPLNTAPPFAGTDLGLSTVASHPHLSIGGDFEITGITIDQGNTTEVGSPTTATANTGLLLKEKTGASTYKDYWILMG